MSTPLLAGFGLGLSLIVAIGAQNLFVLRQGLRREHALAVAAICAISDAVLILLGVSGVGLVLHAVPWLVDAVRWAGATFLVAYGLLAARRAWRPSGKALGAGEAAASGIGPTSGDGAPDSRDPSTSARPPANATTTATRAAIVPVVLTCLALTWLNPHVYLDTLFLLGSVANTHGDARWLFAAGAMTASIVWFFSLAFGARLLGRVLASPRAWRVLDAVVAIVMIALGVSLALPSAG